MKFVYAVHLCFQDGSETFNRVVIDTEDEPLYTVRYMYLLKNSLKLLVGISNVLFRYVTMDEQLDKHVLIYYIYQKQIDCWRNILAHRKRYPVVHGLNNAEIFLIHIVQLNCEKLFYKIYTGTDRIF